MKFAIAKYRPHYRAILRMGLPIMVGQVGVLLTGFADNIMVGRHLTEELSAASFVNNLFMLPTMFAYGFAMGITPLVGEQTGRGELRRAGQTFRYGLYTNGILAVVLCFIMGTLYFYLDRLGLPEELLPIMRPYYLMSLVGLFPVLLFNAFKQFADGTTDTLTPMYILLASNVLNIIGNALLIYGWWGVPEMGLMGAGISTLFARFFTIIVGLWIFMRSRRYHRFKTGFFHLFGGRNEYRQLLTLGLPIAFQLGMETGAFSLSVIFVGWIGSTALAAHQAAITFSTIGFLLYTGIGSAITILISNARGNGAHEDIRPIASAGAHIVFVMIVIVSGIMFLCRHHIGYLFTDSDEVAAIVSAIVIPMMVYQLSDGMQISYAGALRGLGVVKPMVWIAFISYFVVCLPASYLCAFPLGGDTPGVWWGYPVGLSCAAALFFIEFIKHSRKLLEQEAKGATK